MKSLLVFLALAALISSSTACFMFGPVCAKTRGTNTCQRFMSVCKYNMVNRGDLEKVPMSNCPYGPGTRAPCINTIGTSTTVVPPTTAWPCGKECTPDPTALVCVYKVGVTPETCRTFRNDCEFNNSKCLNPNTFALAHSSRCSGLAKDTEGPCV